MIDSIERGDTSCLLRTLLAWHRHKSTLPHGGIAINRRPLGVRIVASYSVRSLLSLHYCC